MDYPPRRNHVMTVGDLSKALEEIPADTPIARMTNGYYMVIKQGADIYYGPIGSAARTTEETSRDEIACGTVVLSFG